MAEIEFLNENPVTMAELKDKLDDIKKNTELGFRANKTLEYLNLFVKGSVKDEKEIKKKLMALEILRLKDKHMIKLIDLRPRDVEELKTLFMGESVIMKDEDLAKILECLK